MNIIFKILDRLLRIGSSFTLFCIVIGVSLGFIIVGLASHAYNIYELDRRIEFSTDDEEWYPEGKVITPVKTHQLYHVFGTIEDIRIASDASGQDAFYFVTIEGTEYPLGDTLPGGIAKGIHAEIKGTEYGFTEIRVH